MSPELIVTIIVGLLTIFGIPIFNYLNTTKQTMIKNDIMTVLSSDTNKIKEGIKENASNLRASKTEIRIYLKNIEKRIDGIERYLEKINGFVPSSGDTHSERSQD
jgi:uncharacterized membrane protein YvbJ